MIIGIDIGGTNTDVVLVNKEKKIIAALKETTTKSIEEGVMRAISRLLESFEIQPELIESVCVGTTHATNAILEAKDLLAVGLIRIAGHRPDFTPGISWPIELASQVIKAYETIPGGYECHGAPITPFDKEKARLAIKKIGEKNVQAVSIVGAFSPMNPDQELEVKALVYEILGRNFPVTCSADIGGIGFLERENATLLNSALKKVTSFGFYALQKELQKLGILAPLSMVHNDGSLMDIEKAIEFPIFTISCGQTNSFRGGARLVGKDAAIIVDVGGTSSDIGVVRDGFAKRSCRAAKIGGVKLHFAMPDVLSLAIGGGSLVMGECVGPESVARRLKKEAQCFGGKTLTLTDVGLQAGYLEIEGAKKEAIQIFKKEAQEVMEKIEKDVMRAVRIARGKDEYLPLVAVGGGAALLRKLDCEIPPFADVANAYGAALSEISSTVDIVTSLQKRIETLDEIKAKASAEAIQKGAKKESVRIVNMEVIPYAYSKESLARVIVTASGPK